MDRPVVVLPHPASPTRLSVSLRANARQVRCDRGQLRHVDGGQSPEPAECRRPAQPMSGFYRGARYGTLGGGTTEIRKDLVGKKIVADFRVGDGFLGMGAFEASWMLRAAAFRKNASSLEIAFRLG